MRAAGTGEKEQKCGSVRRCIIEPLPIMEKATKKLRIFSSLFFGSDTAAPLQKKKRSERERKKMPGVGAGGGIWGSTFSLAGALHSPISPFPRGLACVPRCEGKEVAREDA